MEATVKKKWRKILYEDQGVPDNYVDESFLFEMKKNLHIKTYNFAPLVLESGVVTQQICSVCLFVVVFIYMNEQLLSANTLIVASSIATLLGYIIFDLIDGGEGRQRSGRSWWDDVRTVLIFVGIGYGLSPILMTLTETISTDTIYAMTAAMLLANLLFHHYGTKAVMVSGSLSLNAAIFASVCLASRLHTSTHAFATVTFAVEVFALWPMWRRKLKNQLHHSQEVLTVLLGISTFIAIYTISSVAAILFLLLHLFITFVCPLWLLALQPYKNNIYGPWDEAVIHSPDVKSCQRSP